MEFNQDKVEFLLLQQVSEDCRDFLKTKILEVLSRLKEKPNVEDTDVDFNTLMKEFLSISKVETDSESLKVEIARRQEDILIKIYKSRGVTLKKKDEVDDLLK